MDNARFCLRGSARRRLEGGHCGKVIHDAGSVLPGRFRLIRTYVNSTPHPESAIRSQKGPIPNRLAAGRMRAGAGTMMNSQRPQ